MVRRITCFGLLLSVLCSSLPTSVHATVCDVTVGFANPSQAPISGVLVDVDYAAAPAVPLVQASVVSCTGLVAGGLAEFFDDRASSVLKAGVVRLEPFTGAGLFRCRFDGGVLKAADLAIRAYDAAAADFQPVVPPPALKVSAIVCNDLCSGSNPPNCDDGNVCTTDTCDPSAGCVHTNNTLSCDDGDACTTGDTCGGGVCSGTSQTGCTGGAFCGNGVVEGTEQCDDGNRNNGDACLNTCRAARCGDGVVRGGFEECDNGTANSNRNPDACRTDCTLPACGDGVVDSGEACDDGNQSNADTCVAGCVDAVCGDGYVNLGVEECDDGVQGNGSSADGCGTNCRLGGLCGDANADGRVTPTDAMIILSNAVGLVRTCVLSRCDVNGSATVTATDARVVLGVAVGLVVDLQCSQPVLFRVEVDRPIAELEFSVDYSATAATFVGEGPQVYCTTLERRKSMATFDNDLDTQQLHVELVATESTGLPGVVAVCSVYPAVDLRAEDLRIDVLRAVGPDAESVDPPRVTAGF